MGRLLGVANIVYLAMEVLPLAPIPISGPNEDSSSLGEAFLGGIEASHVSRLVLTSIGPVDDAASIEPDAAAIGRDSDTEQGSTIQLIGCFVDFGDCGQVAECPYYAC